MPLSATNALLNYPVPSSEGTLLRLEGPHAQQTTSCPATLHSNSDQVALVAKYRNEIEQIMRDITASLQDGAIWQDTGTVGNISYETEWTNLTDHPRQIAVPLTITTPDNRKHSFFMRSQDRDNAQFLEQQTHSPAVRKHYPKLYLNVDVGTQRVYLLEQIQGLDYEQCSSGEAKKIVTLLNCPQRFQQLIDNSFAMLCDLAHDGNYLNNIAPHLLKNMMFDRNKNCFRFFDIDSLKSVTNLNSAVLVLFSIGQIADIPFPNGTKTEDAFFIEAYPRLMFALLRKFIFEFKITEISFTTYSSEKYRFEPRQKVEHTLAIKEAVATACKNNDYQTFRSLIKADLEPFEHSRYNNIFDYTNDRNQGLKITKDNLQTAYL